MRKPADFFPLIIILSAFCSIFFFEGCSCGDDEEEEEENIDQCQVVEEYVYVMDTCIEDASYAHELDECWDGLYDVKPFEGWDSWEEAIICLTMGFLFPMYCYDKQFAFLEGCDYDTAGLDECLEGSWRKLRRCDNDFDCMYEAMRQYTDCLLDCVVGADEEDSSSSE